MKLHVFSYRYAQEILEHPNNVAAWNEIKSILENAPLFTYPGKSKNKRLDVVQQLMNTYFDRRFVVDKSWEYHPLATAIADSGLAADYRKKFDKISIQAEVQFGNMSRWYADIFKFQAAYSQNQIQLGLSVVPMGDMAKRIDSNVTNYERCKRELPAAELSITLPILLVGLEQEPNTQVVDTTKSKFGVFKDIVGKGNDDNRWRIINGYIDKKKIEDIGPGSPVGQNLKDQTPEEEIVPSEDE